MNLEIKEREYGCPVCRKYYKNEVTATHCLTRHQKVYDKKCPKYNVGMMVTTHRIGEEQPTDETTTIVKIKGEFVEQELLVENAKEERYWFPACRYNTCGYGAGTFTFCPLVKSRA